MCKELAKRNDVPESLVLALDGFADGQPTRYRELVNNSTHQRLVNEKRLVAWKKFDNPHMEYVFSPMAKDEDFTYVYAGLSEGEAGGTFLLRADRCPEWVFKKFAGRNLLGDEAFLRESPWAETYISRIPKDVFFEAFCQGHFHGRRSDDMLAVVTIPVLPFDTISPIDLRDVFWADAGKGAVAVICGAIRSREFAKNLPAISGDVTADIACLFSEHTSGRTLEAFAKKHPHLAALAACHPNGVDVVVLKSNSKQREVIAEAKGAVPLTGRGMAAPSDVDSVLVL